MKDEQMRVSGKRYRELQEIVYRKNLAGEKTTVKAEGDVALERHIGRERRKLSGRRT